MDECEVHSYAIKPSCQFPPPCRDYVNSYVTYEGAPHPRSLSSTLLTVVITHNQSLIHELKNYQDSSQLLIHGHILDNLCFVSNSIMKHIKKNRTESWTSHALVMAFGSACLSVSWLDTWIPPIVFIVEWRVVICIWKHGPISFEHVSLWCLLFGRH